MSSLEVRDLDFKYDIYDPYTIVTNIGEINKLLTDMKPPIERCLDVQQEADASKKEGFDSIRKWLDIFTNPSNSDYYDTSLKVIKNWDRISEAS